MLTLYKVFQAGSYFLRILQTAILVYVVLSWFRPRFKLFFWLENFVAPFVRPFRRLSLWITARLRVPLDFSCWFAIIGLQIIDALWRKLYILLRFLT